MDAVDQRQRQRYAKIFTAITPHERRLSVLLHAMIMTYNKVMPDEYAKGQSFKVLWKSFVLLGPKQECLG